MSESPDDPKGNPRDSGYARNAHDWYVEPPWTVHDLFDAEQFTGAIWDPACGRGTIPIVAAQRGYIAYGTDLVDRGFGRLCSNFLNRSDSPAPNIVSNPPFEQIELWVRQALRLATDKVAIFGRLALLEGIRRGAWFPTTPLSRVWACSQRVPCPPGETAPPIDAWDRDTITGGFVAYAWFVWQHGHTDEPRLGWLPRRTPDAVHQPELPGT